MDPWEKKKWLVVLALVFVCVGGSIWQERKALPEGPEPQAVVQQEKATKEKPPRITIYISGAVQEPGALPGAARHPLPGGTGRSGGCDGRSGPDSSQPGQEVQGWLPDQCAFPKEKSPKGWDSSQQPGSCPLCRGREWSRPGRSPEDQSEPGGGRRTDGTAWHRSGSSPADRGISEDAAFPEGGRPPAGFRHRASQIPEAPGMGGGVT